MLKRGLELWGKEDVRVRCEGAALLAKAGGKEAVEALLPELRSRNEALRECARKALDQLEVAPLLLGWWGGADAEKRQEALRYALALSHKELLPLLGEAARDKDPGIRKQAAIGLKRHGRSAAVFDLLRVLAADPDKDVRWWAIDSLGGVGGDEAAKILRERQGAETDASLRPFIDKALKQ